MMSEVELYNLAPLVRMMGMGLALALVPLLWLWMRHRQTSVSRRLQVLTVLTLFLTFDLVLFGAFTRLTDSGLGCPDWPGCYGSATPLGAKLHIDAAQNAMPTGPVTHGKAWVEMVHRYLATGVGVLILVLALGTAWLRRRDPDSHLSPWWPSFTLLWVCLQGAFGALTVTMKLFPAIVTLHLLLGIGLLALLTAQATRYEGWQSVALPARWRGALIGVFFLLWVQIALGGWVSTNYAVLACSDFPTCQGQWWPEANWQGFSLWRALGHTPDGQVLPFDALATIHMVHRSMAWLVLTALLMLGWHLRRVDGLVKMAHWIWALVLLQLFTGVSNVVLDWPLVAAVLHTGGASALVVALTRAWCLSCSSPLSPVALSQAGSSLDSRSAA
jgi:heme a synthase